MAITASTISSTQTFEEFRLEYNKLRSTAANSVDVIPYFVKASGSIQLGAVQLAFS